MMEVVQAILDDERVLRYAHLAAVETLGREIEGDDDEAFYEQETLAMERLLDATKAALRPANDDLGDASSPG